ncbi:MAG: exosortase B [Pseudomonadota bacterium]
MTHPRNAFGVPPRGGAASGPAEPDPRRPLGFAADRLFISAAIIGMALAVLFIPVAQTLAAEVWRTDEQGHGPIIIAVSAWLFWHRRDKLREAAARAVPAGLGGWLLLALGIGMYAVGRIQHIVMFQMASFIPLLMGGIALTFGWAVVRAAAFPIFFLVFAVPLPGPIVDMATQPLKRGVSYVAELILYHAGYPISRTGVVLMIGPYQLLVADACAGLNSMFTLEALGLLYMNIVGHTDKLRNVLLAILIIPVSFCANIVRVMILVLVTYYFGDEAGQGFVHSFAGMVLFLVGLTLMLGVDKVLGLLLPARNKAVAA